MALAEQGAKVTAVDIDAESLIVAQDRCREYAVDVEFLQANGASVSDHVAMESFDFVIFFACLEHMTYTERIRAMAQTWDGLRPQALWCCVETPNRLWFFDDHTSRLPFFNWLPDEIAYDYSKYSPRQPFCNSYRDKSASDVDSFLRHGRGVSFHEFDLSMTNTADLDIVDCLGLRLRKNGFLGWRALKRLRKKKFRFEALIASQRPDLHRGFFLPYLDLIIRKS